MGWPVGLSPSVAMVAHAPPFFYLIALSLYVSVSV